MNRTRAAGVKLILSPVPLRKELREAYSSSPAVFMDLASLRRGGLFGAFRSIRSCGASTVVVTGEEADLAVFRDVLSLIAVTIPRAERWFAPPGRAPVPISRFLFPVPLSRIVIGVACGFEALATNVVRRHRICAGRDRHRYSGQIGNKCLYLKPALNFGVPVGGSVGHVAGVANALCEAGKEVRLVAVTGQPLISPKIRQVTVIPHSMAAFPHELNCFRYHRKFLRAVMKEIEKFQPDFIYQRYSLHDMTGIYLRRTLGIPLILEFNGSETWIQRNWGDPLRFQSIGERIETANLLLSDLVVVVSEEIRRQVCSAGVPEEKVLFYPNCVDPSLFDPGRFDDAARQKIRRELGIPMDSDLFTFVGTFGQWHGTEILARAIRFMVEHERTFLEDHNVHFLLVGDGQYGEKVRSILKDVPFVSLPGYRPQHETPGILAASDVCLSPHVPNPDGTPFFGSPTKLFEYMAMAKPIVASDLDQIGWVLRGWQPGHPQPSITARNNAAALLIEPGDMHSLVRGILTAADLGRARRQDLGNRARSIVLGSFTWNQNVESVLNRFGQILAGQERESNITKLKSSNNR